jgi:FixJ family two-component response regulator
MDGMSGPELFDILCERGSTLPVIFLTGDARATCRWPSRR